MAIGNAHFREREYVLAISFFRSAAQHSEKLWQTATFNSALAWLNQGNYDKFLDDYKLLSARFPESEYRRDLLLEEGLLQARSNDPRARQTLELFIKDFPDHPRVSEARLALAEIAYLASDFAAANNFLKVSSAGKPEGETDERGDYLAILMADAAANRDEPKVIEACLKFIRDRTGSALLPEVRMKLGQIYFRREDFANAQTQLELLATDSPASPLTEAALFLAGQASMRSMNTGGIDRALELFEAVAKLNGPLKLYARQEQAIAKARAGKESEAIILYDNILSAKPEPELRFSALCGKGDNLFALGAQDPESLDQAAVVFDDLVKQPEVTPLWRDQALYKKAKCLEKQNKTAEALTAFYDVLAAQSDSDETPEYFWYYKAGFDAARILEKQENWKSAIGIYQKMANLEGPRAEESKTRANQLRLEHFIWEE
jgi:outer membrane protein assembly factor BamD (BamD/ComL family)